MGGLNRLALAVLSLALTAGAPAVAQEPAIAAPEADRVAGWRGDIAVIRDQFLVRDRSYAEAERAEALARLDALDANAARLSDQEIVVGFAQVAAATRNAHTRAYLLRNRGWWRRYPIRIWPFADGWRVIAVQPGYEALLGVKLSRIGGRDIDDVARAVRPLFAGNDAWARYMATYSLTSPDALIGMHVIERDTVAFEGRGADGAVSVNVAPMPLVRRDGPEESWWFLAPRMPGWTHVLQGREMSTFLAEPTRNYLFRRCERGVLYVQFFRAQDAQNETVAAFGQRLLADMQADPPRKLVIDMRFNTGGNLQLARPFFAALTQAPIAQRRDGLYIISGINTFSAGITPMAQVKQDARVTIVGEGPGDDLDFWSEGGNVPLPYSGIMMHFADRMHTYSRAQYDLAPGVLDTNYDVDTLAPDMPTRWRWRDYLDGRDPSLQAIAGRGLRCGAAH
jgi:hypothetical protein